MASSVSAALCPQPSKSTSTDVRVGDVWQQIHSSLSTPTTCICSGTAIPSARQTFSTCIARMSSETSTPQGFGSVRSQDERSASSLSASALDGE